jgi:hypothetical protein
MQRNIKNISLVAMAVTCPVCALLAAPPIPCPIPLEKGTRWTYEGKVETTLLGSAKVYSTNISWVMEVVDSMENTNARAAVISGTPDELAWYEPGQVPGYSVLLNFSNHVYRFPAKTLQQASSLMLEMANEPGKFFPKAEDVDDWFALPLAKDKRWGGDLQREDGWYCWRVEDEHLSKLRIKGCADKHAFPIYTLAYRTNPDHQVLDIAPGLGITRFIYVHHGTVASADVRLVAFKHPR